MQVGIATIRRYVMCVSVRVRGGHSPGAAFRAAKNIRPGVRGGCAAEAVGFGGGEWS